MRRKHGNRCYWCQRNENSFCRMWQSSIVFFWRYFFILKILHNESNSPLSSQKKKWKKSERLFSCKNWSSNSSEFFMILFLSGDVRFVVQRRWRPIISISCRVSFRLVLNEKKNLTKDYWSEKFVRLCQQENSSLRFPWNHFHGGRELEEKC